MKSPLVSIIIPVYNAAGYIAATLRSLAVQTYPEIEVIIVDDGSTDDTLGVVAEAGYPGQLILVSGPRMGAAAARNKGFLEARGSLIKFLDADDLLGPTSLAAQVAAAGPDHIVSGRWGRFHDHDPETFREQPEDCWRSLPAVDWLCSSWSQARSMTNPGIFLIPRTLIERAGLWREDLSLLDDTEYFTRTILAAGQVVFAADALLYYHSGDPTSLSAQMGPAHARSAAMAVNAAVGHLLAAETSERTRRLSANTLQQLAYTLYPSYPELCIELEDRAKQLGGSDLPWPASPLFGWIARLLGWKLAKKTQSWLR